jgi:hypothetical protein
LQFEDPATDYSFAGVNRTFLEHTLKINFNVQNWPFFASSNTLGIEMTALGDGSSSTCTSDYTVNGSVHYITITSGSVTLYPNSKKIRWKKK